MSRAAAAWAPLLALLLAAEAGACPVCNARNQRTEETRAEASPGVLAMLGIAGAVAGGMVVESLRLARRASPRKPEPPEDAGGAP